MRAIHVVYEEKYEPNENYESGIRRYEMTITCSSDERYTQLSENAMNYFIKELEALRAPASDSES